jgi:hypothetical protein
MLVTSAAGKVIARGQNNDRIFRPLTYKGGQHLSWTPTAGWAAEDVRGVGPAGHQSQVGHRGLIADHPRWVAMGRDQIATHRTVIGAGKPRTIRGPLAWRVPPSRRPSAQAPGLKRRAAGQGAGMSPQSDESPAARLFSWRVVIRFNSKAGIAGARATFGSGGVASELRIPGAELADSGSARRSRGHCASLEVTNGVPAMMTVCCGGRRV